LLRSTLSDFETTLQSVNPSTLLEYRKIQGNDVDILEAVFHVTEHFSMHTGQIIMLTKMMTSDDLRFYEFDTGVPVQRWRTGPIRFSLIAGTKLIVRRVLNVLNIGIFDCIPIIKMQG
jgi:hypothetical protein